MAKFSVGKRIQFFLSDFLMVSIMGVGMYFGWRDINIYFLNPKVFTYTYLLPLMLLSPSIIIPAVMLSACPILHGVVANFEFQKLMAQIITFGAILIVLAIILFNGFYLYRINSMGYIKCPGIPVGWTPGMAARYTLDEKLCYQKRP